MFRKVKFLVIENIYKTMLKNGRFYKILGNVHAYIQYAGTWM